MAQLSRGLDGGADLGRVMRVVVVDRGALEHAEKLHAPMRARERVQRGGDVGEADAELERQRGRGGGVLDVVPARLTKVDVTEEVDAAVDRKRSHGLTAVGR